MRMRLYVCTLTLCLATAAQNQPVAFAHDTIGGATDAAMAAAAGNFLTSLTPQLRAKATFPRDSKERTNWHFVPKERLGVSLKEMDLPQRRAAHRLLQSALSAKGYLKATTIMSLEQVLRVLESDRPGAEQVRDQEKYWFAIFGAPLEDIPWGWRVEGHHVSLSNTTTRRTTPITSTPSGTRSTTTSASTPFAATTRKALTTRRGARVASTLGLRLTATQSEVAVVGMAVRQDLCRQPRGGERVSVAYKTRSPPSTASGALACGHVFCGSRLWVAVKRGPRSGGIGTQPV